MPGATGATGRSGAQSEILAEYILSTWGPVLRGRTDADYGIDLYCSIVKKKGRREWIKSHYTVQVKSDKTGWKFKTRNEIDWLVSHPSPVFLCVVDKDRGVVSIYQTLARFDLRVHRGGTAPMVLLPGVGKTGKVANWDGIQQKYDLGPPILEIAAKELFSRKILDRRLKVLEAWISIEQRNLLLRDAGLFRFGGPWGYSTNSDKFKALAEKSLRCPSDEEIRSAISFLAEALDCVGGQLASRGDAVAIFLALALVRWLKRRFGNDIGTLPGLPLRTLEARCHCFEKDKYFCESVDRFIDEMENDHRIQTMRSRSVGEAHS